MAEQVSWLEASLQCIYQQFFFATQFTIGLSTGWQSGYGHLRLSGIQFFSYAAGLEKSYTKRFTQRTWLAFA
jgi:hypothetical protein